MVAVFSQAKDGKPGDQNRQAVGGNFKEVGRHAVKHCKQAHRTDTGEESAASGTKGAAQRAKAFT